MFGCLLLLPAASGQGATTPPNIVFILADDLGWNDTTLNCSNAIYETPNLERLAKRGLRFTQAYAANPLCSPTRASLLTGLYPARIGITTPVCHLPEVVLTKARVKQAARAQKLLTPISLTRLDTNYLTLPKALKAAGYTTGHFGKWHLGPEPYSPLQQGFDLDVPHWPGPGPAGTYVAPWKSPRFNLPARPGEHVEDLLAAQAVEFIKANRDRPFFLNYWAFSVHAPIDAKKELVEKYRAKAAQLPPGSPQRHPIYGAMVQSLDEAVGRLLNTLDELKLTDHTIIVFFSDNGGVHWTAGKEHNAKDDFRDIPITSNTPLRGGKATTYEGGTREPCVILWPGMTRAGTVSDAIIQSTDFFPTFADVLQLKLPAGHRFDGKSFATALRGQAYDRGPTFCHFPHNMPVAGGLASTWVRVGDWKLIRFFCLEEDQSDRLELYNLKEDLGETRNLAAHNPAKAKELNALINGFLRDSEAVVPVKNPRYDPKAKPAATSALPKGANPGSASKSGETWQVTNGVLAVTVSARDAGAVCSLVYDSKEFVNDHDHGRQMQVAWSYNDLDEAYNPTEAGAGQDGTGPRSTSQLVSVEAKGSTLRTVNHPAYWRHTDLPEQYRKNTALVSQDTIIKQLTLGHNNDPHVLVFDTAIIISTNLTGPPVKALRIEAPTLYSSPELSRHYLFDLASGECRPVASEARMKDQMNEVIRQVTRPDLVPILSTPDGRHAVALFTRQGEHFWAYYTHAVPSDDPTNACGKITAFFKHGAAAGQSYAYRTFVVVGDLVTVKASVQRLSPLLPASQAPRPESRNQ